MKIYAGRNRRSLDAGYPEKRRCYFFGKFLVIGKFDSSTKRLCNG